MTSDILYLHEHASCGYYVSDYKCGFTCREIKGGGTLDFDRNNNYLLFAIEGEATINCNEFIGRRFADGDILFIPKFSLTKFTAVTDCRLIVCIYDILSLGSVCNKFEMVSYCAIKKKIKYDFRPVGIIPQIRIFLDQLAYYLEQGVKCKHFHELKQKELFLLFRWFYTKEQLTGLFWPVLGHSFDFRTFIMENYMKVRNTDELAGLTSMSRSTFDIAFRKEFGMPPKQWVLEQKAKHIRYAMSEPGITLSDIMVKFHFNSPTHFNRFCKRYFGCTPSAILDIVRTEIAGIAIINELCKQSHELREKGKE